MLLNTHDNIRITKYWTPEAKTAMIKEIRELAGAGLKDSKLYVDELVENERTRPVAKALDKALIALQDYRSGSSELEGYKEQVARLNKQVRAKEEEALDLHRQVAELEDKLSTLASRAEFLKDTDDQIDLLCSAIDKAEWNALTALIADELDTLDPSLNIVKKETAIAMLQFLAFVSVHHRL